MINLKTPTFQKLLSSTRRAVDDYQMIREGERIAVGVSGGKDSMALLAALAGLSRFYPKKYEIIPIHLQAGFPGSDTSNIKELCDALQLNLVEVKTDIYEVVFEIRKEKSPCSLCANLRRGILYSTAKEHGCNTIALGHHFDDAVETLLMNLFIEGNLGCFSPVTELSDSKMTIIRPLLLAPEHEIAKAVRRAGLIVVKSKCPIDGASRRQEVKDFLLEQEKKDPGLKDRMLGAICRAHLCGW